jgi:hypothetical protein
VVSWATNALDKVRRGIWNQTRRSGQKAEASELKGSRWVLLRNAQDLTANETAKLAVVAKLNAPLYRAYQLKEQLRMVFHVAYDKAMDSLEHWLQWARRCRIDAFVALARTITYYRADIEATLLHGVNNGRVESLNTKVRLIARRAFGFRSAQALIALSELTLGGLCPPLPGRQRALPDPRKCQKTLIKAFQSHTSGVLPWPHADVQFIRPAQDKTGACFIPIEALFAAATFGLLAIDLFTTTGLRINEAMQVPVAPDCYCAEEWPAPMGAKDQEPRIRWAFRLIPKGVRTDKPSRFYIGKEAWSA